MLNFIISADINLRSFLECENNDLKINNYMIDISCII